MSTDVLEEYVTNIFRVENSPSKQPVCNRQQAELCFILVSSEVNREIKTYELCVLGSETFEQLTDF
jgi:hypothetical protein